MLIKACDKELMDRKAVAIFSWTDKSGSKKEGMVVRAPDGLYACQRYCPHLNFPLDFGKILDTHTLHCAAHFSDFDLTTGASLGPPSKSPIAVYKITIEGDAIMVDVPEE